MISYWKGVMVDERKSVTRATERKIVALGEKCEVARYDYVRINLLRVTKKLMAK